MFDQIVEILPFFSFYVIFNCTFKSFQYLLSGACHPLSQIMVEASSLPIHSSHLILVPMFFNQGLNTPDDGLHNVLLLKTLPYVKNLSISFF
jgi:hypothetical protein